VTGANDIPVMIFAFPSIGRAERLILCLFHELATTARAYQHRTDRSRFSVVIQVFGSEWLHIPIGFLSGFLTAFLGYGNQPTGQAIS
jgi:hypothetical protein